MIGSADVYTLVLLYIGVALILAKTLGSVFEHYRLPAVLGEIIAGVFLGASFLGLFYSGVGDVFSKPEFRYPIEYMAHFGIILLLFLSGLETDVRTIKKTGFVAATSTVGGVVLPFVLGYFAGVHLGYSHQASMVLGALLTATSIGVTARTMMDLGVLSTDVGTASLSASVMDDFLGIIAIIIALGATSLSSILFLIFNIFLLVFVELILGWKFIDHYVRGAEKVKTAKAILAFTIALVMIFSAFAQYTVEAAVEGAFFAGLVLRKTPEARALLRDVRALGYGFMIPIFFVHVGSLIDLKVFTQTPALYLAAVILLIAILGKVAGRAIGARVGGFSWRKSIQMGVGSIPRMEIALVAVMLAIKGGALGDPSGVVAQRFLAATMVFVTVTTLITPPLIKFAFREELKEEGKK